MARRGSQAGQVALTRREGASVILFALILLMGGAGDQAHGLTALTQSAALALIALTLLTRAERPRTGEGPLWLLLAAILCLPLVHLLPWPAHRWALLPGREAVSEAMRQAGVPAGWRPFSLDPQLTAEALLETLPVLALLLLGWRAPPRVRSALMVVVVVVALLSALLGGFQRLGGGFAWGEAGAGGDAPGLFVNRNHQALFLLLAVPFAAWLARRSVTMGWAGRRMAVALLAAIVLVLVSGALVTGSRAGLVLLPLALLAAALNAGKGRRIGSVALALLLVSLAGATFLQSDLARRPLERLLGQPDDIRAMLRERTLHLAGEDWPAGGGIGTFIRRWPAAEAPESITAASINHAHNDYLELIAEGGVAVPLLAAGIAVVSGWCCWRRRACARPPDAAGREARMLRWAALAGLSLLALHSLVDFPLRMMSLGAVAGLLAALVLSPDENGGDQQPAMAGHGWAWRWIVLGGTALLLAPIWGLATSRLAQQRGAPAAALAAWPWSSEARTDAGFAALGAGRIGEGIGLARAAIAAAPLNLRAYALLALGLESRGETAQSLAVIAAARRLGRREPRLEYRAMELAVDAGDYAAAARQVDMLLRQEAFVPQTVDFARSLATDSVGNAGLARALARNPAWRTHYMTDLNGLRAEDAMGQADLLTRLRATAAPPTPAEVNALLARQMELGLWAPARTLARSEGRAVDGVLLPEGRAQAGASPAAFGWEIRTGTGGDAWAEPGAPAPIARLRMQVPGTMIGPVLVRRVMRPAGPARWLWAGREERPGAARALRWTLRCEGSAGAPEPLATMVRAWPDGRFAMQGGWVIPPGCPLQILTATVAWQDGGAFGLSLDRLELR